MQHHYPINRYTFQGKLYCYENLMVMLLDVAEIKIPVSVALVIAHRGID